MSWRLARCEAFVHLWVDGGSGRELADVDVGEWVLVDFAHVDRRFVLSLTSLGQLGFVAKAALDIVSKGDEP